ncbi:MAG: hypothetical protein ACLTDV_06445 [Eubacterium sp.]
MVAYRHIENYVPQALALTKTLSDNEAENVFTFEYAPGATNRRGGGQSTATSGRYFRAEVLTSQTP